MRWSAFLCLLLFSALPLAAQEAQTAPPTDTGEAPYTPVTLAGEFLEHNFFNFFAYGNGVYDSYQPVVGPNGSLGHGSFGFEVGGGVNGNHEFRNAFLSLSYRGDYRDYGNSIFGSGTDQNLSLSYTKRINRRWSFNSSTGAGISFYGSSFATPPGENAPPLNPFSPESRYLSSGLSVSYRQSRRLTYTVGGSFFLQRYNYTGAIGVTGGSGSISATYRTTARTTVGAHYSHSSYTYQRNAGDAQIDSVSGSISHIFKSHWTVSASGGVTRTDTNGFVTVPVTLIDNNGQAVGGYVLGKYNRVASFPSFSGSIAHYWRRSQVYASAGQGAASGNGYYLASKSQYINAGFSHSMRRSNISGGYNYYRLSSVSNQVKSQYSSGSLVISYGISLMRYFGANARYEFVHYGTLPPFPGINDSRIAFGFSFSSKSIPLTLY